MEPPAPARPPVVARVPEHRQVVAALHEVKETLDELEERISAQDKEVQKREDIPTPSRGLQSQILPPFHPPHASLCPPRSNQQVIVSVPLPVVS